MTTRNGCQSPTVHSTIKLGLDGTVIQSETAIKEVSKVVNLDWLNKQASSMLQKHPCYNQSFIMNNYLFEMIRKIVFTNYFFLNLYTKSP